MEYLFVVESHKLARRKLPRNATSLRMTKFTRKSDFILLQIYYLLTVKRTDQADVDGNLWFAQLLRFLIFSSLISYSTFPHECTQNSARKMQSREAILGCIHGRNYCKLENLFFNKIYFCLLI